MLVLALLHQSVREFERALQGTNDGAPVSALPNSVYRGAWPRRY